MKKTLLISAVLFASIMHIQAAETYTKETLTANWAEIVGGNGIDMSGAWSVNAQGEIFFTQAVNTFKDNAEFNYADQKFVGSNVSTDVNGSPDFAMFKINQDGKLIMTVYSDRGYFYHNNAPMTSTSDGGFIVAFKQRLTDNTDYDNGKNIMLRLYTTTDPNYVYTIEEPTLPKEDGWINRGYIVKFDKDGKVQWKRKLVTDTKGITDSQGSKKSCSNMFDFSDIVEGSDGHFYILGKYARPMTIEGASKEFIPNNIPSNWDYDFVQHAAGDMFLINYDAEGNYQWTLTHEDGSLVANEGAQDMTIDGDDLYIMGHFKGKQGEKTTFGGKTLTVPTDDIQHQFLMKVNLTENAAATDNNVKVEYTKVVELAPNEANKKAIKPMFITVSGNKVIFGGGLMGILKDGDKEVCKNDMTQYHGYLVAADKNDGSILTGREFFPYNGISGIENAHIVGDSIYVSGYTLSNSGWIYAIDKETLATGKVYHCYNGGGVCTLQSSVLYKNQVTIFGRGRQQPFIVASIDSDYINPAKSFYGGQDKNWETLVCNFTLNGIKNDVSGIENVETAEFTAYASKGCINIATTEPCQVSVYSISGSLLKAVAVSAGNTAINMPEGFYIVNGKKVIVY